MFEVEWLSSVVTETTISISNGTSLNISGHEGVTIDGGNGIQLFNVDSASLYLSELVLKNGNATRGGAIGASEADVTLVNCTFSGNRAVYGGAISVSDSVLVLGGNSSFQNNTSDEQGGGIRASSSSVVLGGSATFESNASERGGGLAMIVECELNFTGNSLFVNNTAGASGGGVFGILSDLYATEAGTSSTYRWNTAESEFGGGIYWRGQDEGDSINVKVPFTFVENSGPTGGGLYLSGDGLQVSLVGAYFESNVATKNGGGLVTYIVGLNSAKAVVKDCTFEGNQAIESGGALVSSAGFVSVQDCSFTGNIAGEDYR